MKKFITILLPILVVLSCNKENFDFSNEQTAIEVDRFFLDEIPVDSNTIYNDTTLAPYIVADKHVTTYAFTSAENEVEWLRTQPFGAKVIESLQIAEELRMYAEQTNAIAIFKATGQVPVDFKVEMERKLAVSTKSAKGVSWFYRDIYSGGSILATTYPTLTGSWNNAITSAEDVSAGFHFYDNWFFSKRFYTWIPLSSGWQLNFAGTGWNDKASSTFNF